MVKFIKTILFLGLFFLPSFAFASSFVEDFEGYTDNQDIADNTTWFKHINVTSAKASTATSTSGSVSMFFAPTTQWGNYFVKNITGDFEIKFNLTSSGSTGTYFYFYNTDDTYNYFLLSGTSHWSEQKITCESGVFKYYIDGSLASSLNDPNCNKEHYQYWFTKASAYSTYTYIDDIILRTELTPQEDWTEQYFTLNNTRSDFYSPISDVCFINKECFITLYYNNLAVGKEIYFLDETAEYNFPEYADFSFTIPATYNNEYLFSPETATTTGQQNYCLYLEDNFYGDILKCGMTIYWYDEDVYVNDIISNTWCNEEVICADIATSSDFLYGFQCGAKKVLCWAFAPSNSSIQTLQTTMTKFQSSFPFNIPFGLINSISDGIETASTTSGGSFGLPMIASSSGELYTVNGIDGDSYDEVLGSSTMATLETYADYFIYFVVCLAITLIIYKYAIL